MGLLSPEEVRRLNREIAEMCKSIVLMKEKKFSDRNVFQAKREAYIKCFKEKWREKALEILQSKYGSV